MSDDDNGDDTEEHIETPDERDDRLSAKIAGMPNIAERADAILRFGEAKWQQGYEAAVADYEEEEGEPTEDLIIP